ncbi:hypothetical protein [Marinicella rhabdoformis]|uniref:hypothetical protein n=1 Tax=Marinicella rhabdoformis TaxID=2580566 RepID=UPI0012AEDC69|nr:hypothetical protein [Marinicella rhabdoformis]
MLIKLLLTALTLVTNPTEQLTTSSNQSTWNADLSAAQLIKSALHPYQIDKTDHLLVTITTPMSSKSKMHLPKGAHNADSIEITIPFESDNYKNIDGSFNISALFIDMNQKIDKATASNSKNAVAHLCGNLAASSQVVVSLSNCSIGTLTNTYECKIHDKLSRWEEIKRDQSNISFAHKCIAPAD